MNDPILRGAYDRVQRKPLCVILQRAFGGDATVCRFFPAREWLTSPTDDIILVDAPLSEWKIVGGMEVDQRPAPSPLPRPPQAAPGKM